MIHHSQPLTTLNIYSKIQSSISFFYDLYRTTNPPVAIENLGGLRFRGRPAESATTPQRAAQRARIVTERRSTSHPSWPRRPRRRAPWRRPPTWARWPLFAPRPKWWVVAKKHRKNVGKVWAKHGNMEISAGFTSERLTFYGIWKNICSR